MSPGQNSKRWNEQARRNLLDEFTELRILGFACNEGATETLAHRYRRRVANQLLELARSAVKAAVIENGKVVR